MTEKKRFASVWDAIEDTPQAAASMRVHSNLMMNLAEVIRRQDMAQAQAANLFGVTHAAHIGPDAGQGQSVLAGLPDRHGRHGEHGADRQGFDAQSGVPDRKQVGHHVRIKDRQAFRTQGRHGQAARAQRHRTRVTCRSAGGNHVLSA